MQKGLTGVALLVLIVGTGGAAGIPGLQQPSLDGAWIFDRSASDDPQPLAADCRSQVHGPGGKLPGGKLDTGILAPRRRTLTETELFRLEQTMQLALDEQFSLHIAQTGTAITLSTADGDTLVVPTDGRKVKQEVYGEGDVESRVLRQGDHLVIERKVSDGGKVTSEYFVSKDGRHLYAVVAFDGKCGQFQFRRVYNRESPS